MSFFSLHIDRHSIYFFFGFIVIFNYTAGGLTSVVVGGALQKSKTGAQEASRTIEHTLEEAKSTLAKRGKEFVIIF